MDMSNAIPANGEAVPEEEVRPAELANRLHPVQDTVIVLGMAAKNLNDGFCVSDDESTAMSALLLDVLIEIREISGVLGSGRYRLERTKSEVSGPQTSVDPVSYPPTLSSPTGGTSVLFHLAAALPPDGAAVFHCSTRRGGPPRHLRTRDGPDPQFYLSHGVIERVTKLPAVAAPFAFDGKPP
jgi:hypothetical protein